MRQPLPAPWGLYLCTMCVVSPAPTVCPLELVGLLRLNFLLSNCVLSVCPSLLCFSFTFFFWIKFSYSFCFLSTFCVSTILVVTLNSNMSPRLSKGWSIPSPQPDPEHLIVTSLLLLPGPLVFPYVYAHQVVLWFYPVCVFRSAGVFTGALLLFPPASFPFPLGSVHFFMKCVLRALQKRLWAGFLCPEVFLPHALEW